MYLGGLKSELSAPSRRKTNAPKPAANASGDAKGSAKSNAAKKKYEDAHKKGNVSAAFKFKREAKKAGVDTTTW